MSNSRFSIALLILSLFLTASQGLWAQEKKLSDKIASYVMDIELDVKNKKLKGQTELIWKNSSEEPIDELYFHMYYNAFKNSKSTFFRERGVPEFLTVGIDEHCNWAWTHISHFKDDQGNELTGNMQYIQTDDDNADDQTVLLIQLADPVAPGSTRSFNFEWEARIPKTMPRTGYNKDFYFFAQWFPKVGVLETAGRRFAEETQWNCHQYHSDGEYYSDFGDYTVNLTVPSDYLVAASGELVEKKMNSDKATWQFFAHDVIDFTWSCSPHFTLHTDRYGDTDLLFYCYDYKSHLAPRYFNTLKFAMAYLEKHVGIYPYSTLSIIDPPIHGIFTGGMEYPTLVTSLSFEFFPEGFRTPETLVVHEYIHQYFMQMVATHEVEEPWMDEGITTYYESRILDACLGDNRSTIDFMGFRTGNKKLNRMEFFNMAHPAIGSNAIKSWEYKHGGYGEIAYNKAALWLQTLEGLIGVEAMDDIMRQYFETWKFGHPTRDDFMAIVNNYVLTQMPEKYPDGMQWFFDQVLFGTSTCDYSIASISNEEIPDHRGVFEDLDNCEIEQGNNARYTSEIILHRLDDLWFPQEVAVIFEDGTSRLFFWDGKARAHSIVVASDIKVVAAEIDPERKIYIDKNFINNSLTIERNDNALDRIHHHLFVRFQSLVEFIGFLL